ncbi:hypothetical protein DSECCO2_561750 [anaerobic digester metagenome]
MHGRGSGLGLVPVGLSRAQTAFPGRSGAAARGRVRFPHEGGAGRQNLQRAQSGGLPGVAALSQVQDIHGYADDAFFELRSVHGDCRVWGQGVAASHGRNVQDRIFGRGHQGQGFRQAS